MYGGRHGQQGLGGEARRVVGGEGFYIYNFIYIKNLISI